LYFFQILPAGQKSGRNKSLHTMLPQANRTDEYATAEEVLKATNFGVPFSLQVRLKNSERTVFYHH
jgi:hypothetical protein